MAWIDWLFDVYLPAYEKAVLHGLSLCKTKEEAQEWHRLILGKDAFINKLIKWIWKGNKNE